MCVLRSGRIDFDENGNGGEEKDGEWRMRASLGVHTGGMAGLAWTARMVSWMED